MDDLFVTFRVTSPEYVSSDLLVKFVSCKKFNKYILVQEDPDEKVKQVHNHFVGETIFNTAKTVRDNLKRQLPNLKGNKDYGVLHGSYHYTASDKDRAYRYTCKGTGPDFETQGPNIIATDLPDQAIRDYHRDYWEYRHNLAKKEAEENAIKVQLPPIPEPEKKTKRTKMFMEKLKDSIIEEFPDKTWDVDDDCDFNYLTKKLYQSLGKTAKNLDYIIFNRMMNGLVAGLPKEYAVEEVDLTRYRDRYRSSRSTL